MEKLLLKRNKESHKGSYGRVGIIGASPGMTGSVFLSSKAALRSGCGYVYTIVAESLAEIMAIKLGEAIIISIEDDHKGVFIDKSIDKVLAACEDLDVIGVGMGMKTGYGQIKLVEKLIKDLTQPLLIDADGINCLKDNIELLSIRDNIVITPHPGEMANLLGVSINDIINNRVKYAQSVADKYNITVVLKGHQTVVATFNEEIYINDTGNPGMATAGSGDVLSGMISALVGQGLSIHQASKLGVYLHGLAGDFAKDKFGETSLIASDIIDNIYQAIKSYKNK